MSAVKKVTLRGSSFAVCIVLTQLVGCSDSSSTAQIESADALPSNSLASEPALANTLEDDPTQNVQSVETDSSSEILNSTPADSDAAPPPPEQVLVAPAEADVTRPTESETVPPPEPIVPVSLTPPEVELRVDSIQFPNAVEQLRRPEGDTNETPLSYREQRYQPNFNTFLRRVTSNNLFQATNGDATHFYSKRQPWNKDQTLLDIGDKLINPVSLEIVVNALPISSERNWSNTNKGLMYGIRSNTDVNALAVFDVYNDTYEIIYSFAGHRDCSLGNSEGNLSNDDRYVVVACTYIDSNSVRLISFDLEQKKVLAVLDAQPNFNWASISQFGEYIVVENNLFPDNNPQLIGYDKYFNSRRVLSNNPAHGDFGIDDNGEEVFAMIDEHQIRYIRLNDGIEFVLSVSNSDSFFGFGHLSCRNLLRPGWCYFSSTFSSWVGAVKITQQERKIEHWGYHRSTSNEYISQPHAVPNRTGSQLLFTSDWYGREEINDYILSAPE